VADLDIELPVTGSEKRDFILSFI